MSPCGIQEKPDVVNSHNETVMDDLSDMIALHELEACIKTGSCPEHKNPHYKEGVGQVITYAAHSLLVKSFAGVTPCTIRTSCSDMDTIVFVFAQYDRQVNPPTKFWRTNHYPLWVDQDEPTMGFTYLCGLLRCT